MMGEDAAMLAVGGHGPEIRNIRMNPQSGELSPAGSVRTPADASFLVVSPHFGMAYAVVETRSESGAVAAYRLRDDAVQVLAGTAESGGSGPCHLDICESDGTLFVANYSGATVGIISLDGDGLPVSLTRTLRHEGSGPNSGRQEQPHPHQALLSPDNRFLYVCDLGTDEIVCYSDPGKPGSARRAHVTRVAPGAGPRHLALTDSNHGYLVNELHNTLYVYDRDDVTGALDHRQELSTLPEDFTGENTAAEIQVHPSGEFVYVSNRGHNSIAAYHRDTETGLLERNGWFSVGDGPRHLEIDPTGTWCVVCEQRADTVTSYRLDPATGRGTAAGMVRMPRPACARFLS